MFNDNFGVALDLGYTSTNFKGLKSDLTAAPDHKTNAFGAGLSGLYSLKITDKFFYTPSLRLGFASGKEWDDIDNAPETKTTTISAGLELLGFEFRPSCHWGLTLGFGGINWSNEKVKDGDTTSNLNLGIINGTEVGFKYYF
jgi:hypothetical protein